MKSKVFSAKKIAVLALFTALGLIVFIIENQFPPLFVPGAKMGLANIFSLAALILYGPVEAFAVVAVRTVLGSLFAGNISMLMYSFSGGVISLALSSVLMYTVYPRVSLMSVSIAAAVLHNIVQNAVYVLVTDTPLMMAYMPYLALIGILSGAIVGAVVALIFKRVPENVFARAGFATSSSHTDNADGQNNGVTVADSSSAQSENSYAKTGGDKEIVQNDDDSTDSSKNNAGDAAGCDEEKKS